MDIVLDPTATALLIAAVIGATELVKQAFDKNWRVVVIIAVSALLGGFGAMLLVDGTALVFFSGLAVGLGASGVVTTAKKLGERA